MSELKYSVKKIKKDVKTIMEFVKTLNDKGINDPIVIQQQFFSNHEDMYNRIPWIVKMICQKKDLKPLFIMIKKLEAVEKGETTLKETSKNLGEELADKYIHTKIKKNEE